MNLVVGLIGDPKQPWNGEQGEPIAGDGLPYASLPKTHIEASDHETLTRVLHRAAEDLGVAPLHGTAFSPAWVSFYRPEDEGGYSMEREEDVVTLVDNEGRAIWNVPFGDPAVTLGALVRARDAGALDGDPQRPYLVLRAGYGNGVLPDWSEFIIALLFLREVLGTLADAHGAGQAIKAGVERAKRLLGRTRRVPEVVQRHKDSWEGRRAWPNDIDRFLHRQPWRVDVLATLLGCSPEEAEVLLVGNGFQQDSSTGLWHPSGDNDGRVLRRVISLLYSFEWSEETPLGSKGFRAELRQKIIEQVIADDLTGPSSNRGSPPNGG